MSNSPEHDDHAVNEAATFHEGIRQFNEGQWFDAHEVWEDIWHLASGQRKLFYQGLIQCAVTIEHIRRGNPRGVRSVYQTAIPKFDSLPRVYMGIDVPRLLEDFKRVVKPILDLPEKHFDPELPRGQVLPFDPASAPKIRLEYDPFDQPHADRNVT